MATKVTGRARDEFQRIVRQLEPDMERIVRADVQRIQEAVEELYKITFALWQRSRFAGESAKSTSRKGGMPRVKWDEPDVRISIRGRTVTARVVLGSTVIDPGGRPHRHWYRLDKGWPSITANQPMVFPKRAGLATQKGNLQSKFPTYARKANGKIAYTTIRQGETRRGYEGNSWSETIVDELRLPPGLTGWKITSFESNDPT